MTDEIELHWKNDELLVQGLPAGYRYLLATCHQPKEGGVPKSEWVDMHLHDGSYELRFLLPEGNFMFRARGGDPFDGNYEIQRSTGILPVALGKGDENYRQLECVEGFDEFPDQRTHMVRR